MHSESNMGLLDSLHKLTKEQVFVYLFLSLGLIIPGMIFLYITKQNFLDIEIIKLIFLSIIFSLPIYMANAIMISSKSNENEFMILGGSGYLTLFSLFISTTLFYMLSFFIKTSFIIFYFGSPLITLIMSMKKK